MKFLRRIWSRLTQAASGGLVMSGDWRVRYTDGRCSRYLTHGDANNLRKIFGGKLEWRHDQEPWT